MPPMPVSVVDRTQKGNTKRNEDSVRDIEPRIPPPPPTALYETSGKPPTKAPHTKGSSRTRSNSAPRGKVVFTDEVIEDKRGRPSFGSERRNDEDRPLSSIDIRGSSPRRELNDKLSDSVSSFKPSGVREVEERVLYDDGDTRSRALASKLEQVDDMYLELEEAFNRDMESARRNDLIAKRQLRQSHVRNRNGILEELLELSDKKSKMLVQLMQQREAELVQSFETQLVEQRRKYEAQFALLEQELAATVQVPMIVHQPAELPFFGIEIEDGGTAQGIKVMGVSGPSAVSGLQAGDLVHQLTIPITIRSREDFDKAALKVLPGERVHVAFNRAGQLMSAFFVAGSRSDEFHAQTPAGTPIPIAAPPMPTALGQTTPTKPLQHVPLIGGVTGAHTGKPPAKMKRDPEDDPLSPATQARNAANRAALAAQNAAMGKRSADLL